MPVDGVTAPPATSMHAPTRVLVADDDEDNRVLLKTMLAARGHQVVLACDGVQALEMGQAPDLDLILLDHMMPGLTGLEVLTQLRARGHDVPIIMVTAVGDPAQVAAALGAGADDYVTKPFSPLVLLARLERRLRPRTVVPPPVVRAIPPPVPAAPATRPPGSATVARPRVDQAPRQGHDNVLNALFGLFKRGRKARSIQPSSTEPVPGTVLSGRYRLDHVVGRGAFGVVYQAFHVDLESDVAVKVLQAGAAVVEQGMSTVDSFRLEAVRACRVRHPNAVRVWDFGITQEGHAYLVMDLLHGESLEVDLEKHGGRLDPKTSAAIMAPIFGALSEAHTQGVIHQDVKPSNIFLQQDAGGQVPKLIDFGAAAEASRGPAAFIVGTPTHMAPERYLTNTCGPKADCYAAGVTLYELVTGELPYVGPTVDLLRQAILDGGYTPASHFRPGLPPAWDALFARLLASDPQDRPTAAQAEKLVRALA